MFCVVVVVTVFFVKKLWLEYSLEVQWLGFHNFTAKGMGSVSGLRTKIQKKKKELRSHKLCGVAPQKKLWLIC